MISFKNIAKEPLVNIVSNGDVVGYIIRHLFVILTCWPGHPVEKCVEWILVTV